MNTISVSRLYGLIRIQVMHHSTEALKADRISKNLDTAKIKEPDVGTMGSYHAALMSIVGVTERVCASKSHYREAAETSQQSVLANAA